MKKIDKTVLRETAIIAVGTVLFSVITQIVFLAIGRWDFRVLTGNLMSGSVAVLNFFLMGLTVQLAVGKSSKEAENFMRISLLLRTVFLFGVTLTGVLLPYFNTLTVFLPLFFPRLTLLFRPLFMRKEELTVPFDDIVERSDEAAEKTEIMKEKEMNQMGEESD